MVYWKAFTSRPRPKVPARNMGDGTLERDLKWFSVESVEERLVLKSIECRRAQECAQGLKNRDKYF